MKKTLAVVGAVALAGVLSITAAGCSTKTRNLASLSSNWYYDTAFKRIQPTFDEDAAEKLTYKVTQTEKSKNATYSMEYADGTYTTEFYAKKITATELEKITYEDWREDYTKALGKDGYMYVYYYSTKLSIPSITFTCGEQSETFKDQSVVTESYFLSVQDYLSPVYSVRTVNMAIPKELQTSSLEGCYHKVDMVYTNYYTLFGGNVMTLITDNNAEGEKNSAFTLGGMNSTDNSVFDMMYLDIVARAMRNVSNSFSQTISLYSPGLQLRNYTVASSAKAVFTGENAEDQLKGVQKLLEDKGLFTPKPVDKSDSSEGQTKLQTAAISVAYNGGSFSGVSQTYWFAVGTTTNETRTLMVKYSEPLSYNLGTVDYVLTSIDNIGL